MTEADLAPVTLFVDIESLVALGHLELIHSKCGEGIWTGIGADAFRDELSQAIPDLRKLATSHDEAQRALYDYAALLDQAQALARSAADVASTAADAERRAAG